MLQASEERRASEPPVGEGSSGPVAPCQMMQEAESTAGEARPTVCPIQGALTQRAPSTEACRGADPGLRARAEVGIGDTLSQNRGLPPYTLPSQIWLSSSLVLCSDWL